LAFECSAKEEDSAVWGPMTSYERILEFGLTLSASQKMIKVDLNNDQRVDLLDLGVLSARWKVSPATAADGDFDGSGTVDLGDLLIFANSWLVK
jgi:hypothetical protein